MNVVELIIFCVGIFTITWRIGYVAAELGSKFGRFLAEKEQSNEKDL